MNLKATRRKELKFLIDFLLRQPVVLNNDSLFLFQLDPGVSSDQANVLERDVLIWKSNESHHRLCII